MNAVKSIMLRAIVIMFLIGVHSSVLAQDPDTPPIDPVFLESLRRAEERVEVVRDLEAPAVIHRELIDPNTLSNEFIDDLTETYSVQDAADDMLFYTAFGLIPGGFDLYENVRNNTNYGIQTHYNPELQTMRILSTIGALMEPLDSLSYAYGYAMYLQDLNYDSFAMRNLALERENYDQAMAINALISGDATLSLQQYIQALIASNEITLPGAINTIGQTPTTLQPDTPEILVNEVLFPSQEGLQFVQTLYNETDSWRLVNLVYERPPLSTEHILHPTLYLLYEAPHEVTVAPMDTFWATQQLNPDVWTLRHNRSLGEFYMREHLAAVFLPDVVDTLATGWGGDLFQIYSDDQRNAVMIWRTSWDTLADFEEFNLRYSEFITSWIGVEGEASTDGTQCWMGAERSICKAILNQEDVLITHAPTIELARHALDFQLDHLSTSRILG